MKRSRLVWLLYPSYVAVAVMAVAAVAAFALHAVRVSHLQRTESQLTSAARMAAALLAPQSTPDAAAAARLCRELGDDTGYRLTLIDPRGVVLGDSEANAAAMMLHADRPEFIAAMAGRVGIAVRHSDTLQRDMLYVACPVPPDGPPRYVIRAATSLAHIADAERALRRRVLWTAALAALAAAGVGIFASRRITGALAILRRGAERFAGGRFDVPIAPSLVTEVDSLIHTMNTMAAQLDRHIADLTAQRDEQAALFGAMREGVLAVDLDKRIIRINAAAARLFQIDAAACRGRDVLEVARHADLLAVITHTLTARAPAEALVHLPEEDRYLQAQGTVLQAREGEVTGALVVLNDVTRARRLETMRRDFVANVSHELKTPITSIKGFAETLLDGAAEAPADRERFLRIIVKQSNRLHAIVEDLLSLAAIEHEADTRAVELAPTRLAPLLEGVVKALQPAASAAGAAVALECPADLTLRANAPLLERAVSNLLDNAIKYSGGKPVRVAVAAGGREVAIRVVDQGPGIPQKHLPRLFERFYRVDKGRSRELGGTGLGLAIVKHIALAHGGRVEAQSTVGEGSAFTIHLPA